MLTHIAGRSLLFPLMALWMTGTILMPAPARAQGAAGQSAVVLNYQRFGEDRYPETSVDPALFEAQVRLLAGKRYNVESLQTVIDTLFADRTLPNRTVAISMDDAYRSVYEVAWPILKRAGLGFTLFVATDHIDGRGPGFMTWDQIRELRDAGVTIGAHSAAHPHLVLMSPQEVRADFDRAMKRFEEELGERPTLFSYPHGEMSLAVRDVVEAAGFQAAFGQHSGTVNRSLDRYMLPRFSINSRYGTAREFKKRIDTLGLPLVDVTPRDPFFPTTAPTTLGFTIDASVWRGETPHCFYAGHDDDRFVEVKLTDLGNQRFEISIERPAAGGSWRINCTMATGGSRYRWYGMQYYTVAD